MATFATRLPASNSPADAALEAILQEIAVPKAVLTEARHRRDLVLELAMTHEAARAKYVSGSVAHGTHNKPLEDTDCGVKIDRSFKAFRAFGPDAPESQGPEAFIQMFAAFIEPQLHARGYARAEVNLDGNRAIKFEFNEPVDIDDWGPVDPYVDLIVGLSRATGGGLWIPNRRENGWDAADPEHHTWLMTKRDPKALRVHRTHVLRLGKRAVKRDAVTPGQIKVMCSWNLSAIALDYVDEERPTAAGLAGLFADAASSIATGLTEDPSPVVQDPIKLPDGVTCAMASERLEEMAAIVTAAMAARSRAGAREQLKSLYGDEIDAIKAREREQLNRSLAAGGDSAALGSALHLPHAPKQTRSDGA